MTEIAKAIGRIRSFFTSRPRLSRSALAGRIGVHRNTIGNVLAGSTDPKADTLERLLQEIDRIERQEAAGPKGRRPKGAELQAA